MNRLANDCFAVPADMITALAALDHIKQAAITLSNAEICDLTNCEGRVLAEDIHSLRNVPPADNSAVDGYAFSYSAYEQSPGKEWEVSGRSAAGRPFTEGVDKNTVIKILTGANMPNGFDTVAMIEDIARTGGAVILPANLQKGANRRKKAEDIKIGQRLLEKGTKLRPQEIGYLASVGTVSVAVFRKIRVALFSTGDELINPGDPEFDGGIYDSNRFILTHLLRSFGCDVTDLGILRDNEEDVRMALADAAQSHDLVITSGGVSVGDEDHVKSAVLSLGQLHFWRIAIKPGRPLAMGQIKDTAFVGLPGNPIASFVCCLKFVRPLVTGMSGSTKETQLSFQVPSQFTLTKKPGRTEWLRGKYCLNEMGVGAVEKYYTEGSGILSSAVWANGLIELGDDITQINKGDPVTFLPFSELMK
jgi:molybdopterin molybdotransferase